MYNVNFFLQSIAVVNSGLLLMAVMGLLFPAVLHYTHSEVHFGKSELALSRFSSCIMLIAYGAYLYYQLKTQVHQYVPLNEVGIFVIHAYSSQCLEIDNVDNSDILTICQAFVFPEFWEHFFFFKPGIFIYFFFIILVSL